MSVRRWVEPVVRVLGSYGLVVVILVLLLVLTFFGTLEQTDHSLYEVQKKYFESLIVVGGRLPIPLPGAYLLLSLLFVNLLVGGMLRLKRSWSRAGIFAIHIGIATLLVGGFVEYRASRKGHLTLFEGESSAEFKSYFEWEVALIEPLPDGSAREYVIPNERFADMKRGQSARMVSADLPFDVTLSGFLENCRPKPAMGFGGDGDPLLTNGIDGFVLERLPNDMTAEANVAGVTVTLEDARGARRTGLLWGLQRAPWTVDVDGTAWQVELRKRSWELPFRVHLDDFTRELHPGIGMAKGFYSDVTCLDGNVSQELRISMNEPLRRDGFTLYQASWGPGNAGPSDRLFSTFAVVENPADRVPLVACIVIALGLLLNFVPKLLRHVRLQGVRSAS